MNINEAIELSDEAHVICSILHPYPVLFANKAWTAITEYEQHEIAGQTLKMLQGPLTNLDNVREMMNSVHSTGGGECEVVNYTKSGSPYLAKVQVIPIISKSQGEQYISHYMGVTTASKISDKDNESHSMIFSLVNAEEYGWLVKTVSDLQSDRDSSSDQRSNTSSNSKDSGDGVRRPRKRYTLSNDNGGSGSGSDSGSNGQGMQSVSAISSGGTSQEGGSVSSRNGSRNGDSDLGHDRGDRKPSPTNSSGDEKDSSRSNSISISISASTAEKESNTSAEGSEMGSISIAQTTGSRERKRKSPRFSTEHQHQGLEERGGAPPSKSSRTRSSRRLGRDSSRGFEL